MKKTEVYSLDILVFVSKHFCHFIASCEHYAMLSRLFKTIFRITAFFCKRMPGSQRFCSKTLLSRQCIMHTWWLLKGVF